ncbi:1472_t:CDS:2 [Dentiscutata erythropus]|uniref:1472_t:CDS:1 n=1 Tax=Dentiscutata erythropus TaxID=1348616 RepID=A0A9N9NA95_9GLOM|nr:1472_t:CDS:2 [Dentiscutata erythropus]
MKSQIDDIWMNPEIALAFEPLAIIDADYTTRSDHKILLTEWYMLSTLMKQAAKDNILSAITALKVFHAHSFKTTQLYRGLKVANKTLALFKSIHPPLTPDYIISQINKKLKTLSDLTGIPTSPNISDLQKQQHIQIMTTLLNNHNFDSSSTKVHLQNLQNKALTNTLILIDELTFPMEVANFFTVKDTIRDIESPTLSLKTPNPYFWQKATPKKNKWIITANKLIGKITSYTQGTIRIRHWVLDQTRQVQPCPNCEYKIANKRLATLDLTSNTNTSKILVKIQRNNKRVILTATIHMDNKPIIAIQNKTWSTPQKVGLTALLILLTLAPSESKIVLSTNSTFVCDIRFDHCSEPLWLQQVKRQDYADYEIGINTLINIKFFNVVLNSITPTTEHNPDLVLTEFIPSKALMLLNELPTFENLNKRHPEKYELPTCRRCLFEIEDNTHWLICNSNTTTISQIILQACNKLQKSNELSNQHIQRFIAKYTNVYITNKTPIGVITSDTRTPKNIINAIELHDMIAKLIHELIWVLSRVAVYSSPVQNNNSTNNMVAQVNQKQEDEIYHIKVKGYNDFNK